MSSKRSTSVSAPNFTKYPKGLPLNFKAIKKLFPNSFTSCRALANELGLSESELRKKLYLRKRFEPKILDRLVQILGARRALDVIWFPTLQEKKEVRKYVLNTVDEVDGIQEALEVVKQDLRKKIECTNEERQQLRALTLGFDKSFASEFFRRER